MNRSNFSNGPGAAGWDAQDMYEIEANHEEPLPAGITRVMHAGTEQAARAIIKAMGGRHVVTVLEWNGQKYQRAGF